MKPSIILIVCFLGCLASVSAAAIEMGNSDSLQKGRDSKEHHGHSRIVQAFQTRKAPSFSSIRQHRLFQWFSSKSKLNKPFDEVEKEYQAKYAKKSLGGVEKYFEHERFRLHNLLISLRKKWDKKCVLKTVELVVMAEKWVTQREARGELFQPDHRKRLQGFVNYIDMLMPALHETQGFPALRENAVLADYLTEHFPVFQTKLSWYFDKLEHDLVQSNEVFNTENVDALYTEMLSTWYSVRDAKDFPSSWSLNWQDKNHKLLVQTRTWFNLEAELDAERTGSRHLGNLLHDHTIEAEFQRTKGYIRGILARGLKNQILRQYFEDNLAWLEVFLLQPDADGIPAMGTPTYNVALKEGEPPEYVPPPIQHQNSLKTEPARPDSPQTPHDQQPNSSNTVPAHPHLPQTSEEQLQHSGTPPPSYSRIYGPPSS